MTIRVLTDDARGRPGRALLFENPTRVIRADSPVEVSGALDELQSAAESGAHLAGFLSYELGYVLEAKLEGLMPRERDVPLIWFGVFPQSRTLDGQEIEAFLAEAGRGAYTVSDPALTLGVEEYCARFEAVKRYIAAGDIYQLNLTMKGRFAFSGDAVALYADLRRKQPVSHAALVQTDEFTVVSASPELFLEIDGSQIATRPMKGTAPRALTLDEDEETTRWLASDEKSRAENLMIVDLMRNDVGRVAETGSVRVSDLFTVETYETLHQMTSGVEAKLRPGTGITDLLRSLFPPGSVTGAPKVRAMEIIRELESEARGVYTGAIGAISPDGQASFNVAIRTLTLFADGRGEVGIGSGVVHDSLAQAEYDECLLKMRFLTEPVRDFQLIETMLYEPERGEYVLLQRHLDRLEASARYFLFPFARERIIKALQERQTVMQDAPYRVRLLLFRDGDLSISETRLDGPAMTRMLYVVSDETVDSGNLFLFHKTTERQVYDREWARMHDLFGSDEVIFINERGELAEGSRTNIFLRLGGELLTPALSCGLLPGTLREELLAAGEAQEAVLTLDDLARAEDVYLGNSVRGLVPATQVMRETARSAAS